MESLTMSQGVKRVQMPNKQWLATYACLVFIAVELLYLYANGLTGGLTVLWNGKQSGLDGAVSAYVGGVPGYTVFDNLWFHVGHFHYFDNDPLPVDGNTVMKGRDSIVWHSVDELEALLEGANRKKRYRGESIFINTGYGTGSVPRLVEWYYHFATELIMGPMSVLSALRPGPAIEGEHEVEKRGVDKLPDWLVIPENDWKDHYGLNEFLVDGTFADSLVDQAEWRSHEDQWIRFDRVVIADREASGADPEVQAWNKMAAHALTLGGRSRTAFEPLRRSMLRHLHFTPQVGGSVPKAVYVDRQDTSRRLSDVGHGAILDILTQLRDEGRVVFTHGRFGQGAMRGVREQVEAVLNADIMIGVHGNGLTHMLFMPTGGQIIEIFPPETFLRDYQLVAEALSHTHHAVQNDTTYTRSEWEQHPGEQNPDALHDGSVIPLDAGYIADLLRDVVEQVTAGTKRREKR